MKYRNRHRHLKIIFLCQILVSVTDGICASCNNCQHASLVEKRSSSTFSRDYHYQKVQDISGCYSTNSNTLPWEGIIAFAGPGTLEIKVLWPIILSLWPSPSPGLPTFKMPSHHPIKICQSWARSGTWKLVCILMPA